MDSEVGGKKLSFLLLIASAVVLIGVIPVFSRSWQCIRVNQFWEWVFVSPVAWNGLLNYLDPAEKVFRRGALPISLWIEVTRSFRLTGILPLVLRFRL